MTLLIFLLGEYGWGLYGLIRYNRVLIIARYSKSELERQTKEMKNMLNRNKGNRKYSRYEYKLCTLWQPDTPDEMFAKSVGFIKEPTLGRLLNEPSVHLSFYVLTAS